MCRCHVGLGALYKRDRGKFCIGEISEHVGLTDDENVSATPLAKTRYTVVVREYFPSMRVVVSSAPPAAMAKTRDDCSQWRSVKNQ